MIQVFVNNREQQIEVASSLMDLMKILHREEDKRLAVAINNKVIARVEWENTILQNDDKIVLIHAVYGG
ncbi:MAG: sulfur carrier protein ThiS [Bacteroidales bacterium]|jgi:sulfur carrier protein|nr:sulfur carrier protein ThiS [Bacteroidales bacterium]MDD2686872.1 sulfur carrier protein ThiS [Bacteroidales bacterium]MDD3329783.1 sulfur carrier protein ThiS [Bacteroidales bacterium]MDD3690606.1 sulfur carrier protein ThiS [Bacteroidales bacterium]MDD4044028.1 sulfur carrier protein ThiS [Bacteroidales bacterium]